MKTMEERITSLEQEIKAIKATLGMCDTTTDAGALKMNQSQSIKEQATALIHELGIPAHLVGHKYVREAIIAVNDQRVLTAVTKVLYPKVADAFGSTPSRVERGIRHAIEVAWDRGNLDSIHRMFKYTVSIDRGKPTNAEFIALLVDFILMKGENNEMD